MPRCATPAALATVALTALAGPQDVMANGRFPASVSVAAVPDSDQDLLLPVTFGLLVSRDNGATFRWICEAAVGYGGVYDPDYALEPDGDIWATTFDGLRLTRDGGCTWTTIGDPLTGAFVGEVEIGPDGTVWATTSTGGEPNDVYRSTDGETFTALGVSDGNAWWRTLRIAPSDPGRVYVSGFRPSEMMGDVTTEPEALLRRSVDGTAFEVVTPGGLVFGSVPQINLLAVASDDPDTLWAVTVNSNDPIGDRLYVSHDAGDTWKEILAVTDSISAFLAEPKAAAGTYDIIVGTINDGNYRVLYNVADTEPAWARKETPRMACLTRRADGTYFSCGANWEPDFFTLGRSNDGETWTKVVRFSELTAPVSCPEGTIQRDVCEAEEWPGLVEQFGIGGEGVDAGPGPDADPDNPGDGDGGGCCDSGPGHGAPWLLAVIALALVGRRRRPVRPASR